MAKRLKKANVESYERRRRLAMKDQFDEAVNQLEAKHFEDNVRAGFFVPEEMEQAVVAE